jgi:hypothetical protein
MTKMDKIPSNVKKQQHNVECVKLEHHKLKGKIILLHFIMSISCYFFAERERSRVPMLKV